MLMALFCFVLTALGTLMICGAGIAYFIAPQLWPHELLWAAGGVGMLAWWRRLVDNAYRRDAQAQAELLADAIYRRAEQARQIEGPSKN